MWEACKTTHDGISEHKISSLFDVWSNQKTATEKKIRQMKCESHKRMTYIYFCKTCECFICSDCFDYGHPYDETIEISEYVAQYFNESSPNKYLTNTTAFLADSGVFDLRAEYHNQLQLETLDVFDDYLSLPGSSTDNSSISLTKGDSCDKIVSIDSDNTLYSQKTIPERALSTESTVSTSSNSSYVLVQRTNSLDMIDIYLTKTITYKINIPSIHMMEFLNDHEIYIGYRGGDISKTSLKPFPFFSRTPKIVNTTKGMQVMDFTVTSEGDIIFIKSLKKTLSMVTKTCNRQPQVSDLHKLNDMEPISIHLNKESHVLRIGLVESHMNLEVVPVGSGKIESMLLSGRAVYKYGQNEFKLFSKPTVIKEKDNSLYVVDQIAENEGRIVSVDIKTGRILWTYSDCLRSQLPFLPTDLSVMQSKIFVLDSANLTIHIMNVLGYQLTTNSLSNLQISHPIRINFDNLSNLWIACGCNETYTCIHKIKVLGI